MTGISTRRDDQPMILSVRHSATRFVRDSVRSANVDVNFGCGIEHLNLVDYILPTDLVLMRDPDKVLLSNYRDPWRSWERTIDMLWKSLEPLYGSTPTRFRVDKDDWSVLEKWVGHSVPKGERSYSSGVRGGAPTDGWDWVEEYAKFYYGDVNSWPEVKST